MKIYSIKLGETERAALEAHRIRLGCRSGAETIRSLLAGPGSSGAGARAAANEFHSERFIGEPIRNAPATNRVEVSVPIGPVRPKPGQLQKGKKG